jgi:hypothetical protein
MRGAVASTLVILLLVASMAGCVSEDDENERPVAEAGQDVEAEVGEEVIFSGTGLDDDGSIVVFRWDFDGDGEWDWSGEVGSRIHVYDRPGEFEAVLEVEDDEGAKDNDTRWVNVTATIRINVDWTDGSSFVVHVSDRLNADHLEVDWTMEGAGPTPIRRTFTHDAGLVKVNDTAYSIDPSVDLAAGQEHTVKVRIRDLVVARRTVDVVDVAGPEGAYNAVYEHSLWDERWYGDDTTQLWREGTLDVEARIGWTKGEFEGTGSWYTFENRSSVLFEQWVTLDEVAVRMDLGEERGDTWWMHSGSGDINQTSQTSSFFIYAYVQDLEMEMENGSLVKDDWRRVGRYTDTADPDNTTGSFEWNRTTLGNQVRRNGDGELIEVLKVLSERTYEGTNRGLDFYLHNTTTDYDASRLIFHNRTLYRTSEQEVGNRNGSGDWLWSNTSFSGFMDAGDDGDYNPDPLNYTHEVASRFHGPRPRVLVVGDAFAATSLYGVNLAYVAKRVDRAPLLSGFSEINVTGVLVEAIYNSTWGKAVHWMWVLEDGPLPGLVYEERVRVERDTYGGGTYDWYRNIESVTPLT